MNERKELGKIKSIHFGHGGYQDCMIGLTLTLGGDGWGVGTFESGFWDPCLMKRSEHAKWTELDRQTAQCALVVKISELLRDAKVSDVMKLKDVPVECTFDGTMLKSWRILTEVI